MHIFPFFRRATPALDEGSALRSRMRLCSKVEEVISGLL
jgi:hypothetical protein